MTLSDAFASESVTKRFGDRSIPKSPILHTLFDRCSIAELEHCWPSRTGSAQHFLQSPRYKKQQPPLTLTLLGHALQQSQGHALPLICRPVVQKSARRAMPSSGAAPTAHTATVISRAAA